MQGLIIAVIIVTFLYNIYKNFKKEMEKSKARAEENAKAQQAQAQVAPLTESYKNTFENAGEQSYPTNYDKALAKEYVPTSASEPYKESNVKERAKQKEALDLKANKKKPVYDYYNSEVPSAEVIANRRIHQPHKHGFKIAGNKKVKHPVAGFNFKQALIYDAILRRPRY